MQWICSMPSHFYSRLTFSLCSITVRVRMLFSHFSSDLVVVVFFIPFIYITELLSLEFHYADIAACWYYRYYPLCTVGFIFFVVFLRNRYCYYLHLHFSRYRQVPLFICDKIVYGLIAAEGFFHTSLDAPCVWFKQFESSFIQQLFAIHLLITYE